ncbi:MAG: hypothetical protein EBS53_12240 [Bacteroidetes bacterium]|nr:hypothetical protein [Bacteroidota bacterium]
MITNANDTVSVVIYENTKPSSSALNPGAVTIAPRETTTANTFVGRGASTGVLAVTAGFQKYNGNDGLAAFTGITESQTAGGIGVANGTGATARNVTFNNGYVILGGGYSANGASTIGSSFGNVGATFGIQLESNIAYTLGTYTYKILVTTYSSNSSGAGATYTMTTTEAIASIVVGATSATTLANDKTPAAANATLFIGTSSGPTSDAVVTAEATASTTPKAYLQAKFNNTNGTAGVAEDSLTATISGPGLICSGDVCGKELRSIALTAGVGNLTVRSDGTAGTATINVKSTVVTFGAKTVTFYAKSASTMKATVRHPVLQVGSNSGAIGVTATDANGIAWTGTAYIYATSAASALIAGSETPSSCTWTATDGIRCSITGKLVGTATFKVIDAATVATATASSDEFTVTVSAGTPGSVKLAFDKATYAPFEKAKITVTVLDTDGKGLPAQTISSVFATGGITSSVGFSQSSDTLTATSVVLQAASSSSSGAVAGSQVYFVYMPASSGDVTISATGSTGLPASARVAVSAKATVVSAAETAANTAATTAASAVAAAEAATDAAAEAIDAANAATDAANLAAEAADAATVAAEEARDAADAATAAVEELATQVATLMAALKAQITTLANTVAKIAKKVKA